MTWKQLSEHIAAMTPEQQADDVGVYLTEIDEHYHVDRLATGDELEISLIDDNAYTLVV